MIENLESIECSICITNFEKKKDFVITSCSHIFHRACLEEWEEAQQRKRKDFTCPMCNKNIGKIINQDLESGRDKETASLIPQRRNRSWIYRRMIRSCTSIMALAGVIFFFIKVTSRP